jgi:hypothetical protein
MQQPNMTLPVALSPNKLPSRVELFMDILEPALFNMGVELGCSNIRMAEHELHRPEISTVFKKMRGKRMPEDMGADLLTDACLSG